MKKLLTGISLVAVMVLGANASELNNNEANTFANALKNEWHKLQKKTDKLDFNQEFNLGVGYGKVYGNNNVVVRGDYGISKGLMFVMLSGTYTKDSYDIDYTVGKVFKPDTSSRFIVAGAANVQYVNFNYDSSVASYKTETVLVEDGKGNTTEQTQTVQVDSIVNKNYNDYLVGLNGYVTDIETNTRLEFGVAKGVKGDLAKAKIGIYAPIYKIEGGNAIMGGVKYERTFIFDDTTHENGVDSVVAGISYSF